MAKSVSKEETKNQALTVPDYLKGVQSNADEMVSGVGVSVPRIYLKGRRFKYINGEEEIKADGPEEVIILGVEPRDGLSKTWYEKAYNPSTNDPPDCSSWDGIRPDSWVNKPQCKLCALCPQAQWGSATSMAGKKAKACKESKRLIVVRNGDIDGVQYVLTVTISSLKALGVYGKWLAQNQLPFSAVVTEMDFAESDFPELTFEFKRFLDEEDGVKCIAIAEERPWASFTNSKPHPTYEGQALEGPAPSQSQKALPSGAPSSAQAPVVEPPASEEDVNKLVNNW